MTVRELKDALAALGPERDRQQVRIWLPGSRIRLVGLTLTNVEVLIEGNIEPGSVLNPESQS